MKIIVADDSLVMRKIIINVVESLGYEAVHATNGQHVLEFLEKDGPEVSLVLLDWNMPLMNGLEVVKAMQADSRFRSIPIMMVSTESEQANIVQAIKAGAKNYITKPFTPQDLATKILETMGQVPTS